MFPGRIDAPEENSYVANLSAFKRPRKRTDELTESERAAASLALKDWAPTEQAAHARSERSGERLLFSHGGVRLVAVSGRNRAVCHVLSVGGKHVSVGCNTFLEAGITLSGHFPSTGQSFFVCGFLDETISVVRLEFGVAQVICRIGENCFVCVGRSDALNERLSGVVLEHFDGGPTHIAFS